MSVRSDQAIEMTKAKTQLDLVQAYSNTTEVSSKVHTSPLISVCVRSPSGLIPVSVTQPLYPEAEEQRGRTWFALLRTEPTFFSPTFRLNHRDLCWWCCGQGAIRDQLPHTEVQRSFTPAILFTGKCWWLLFPAACIQVLSPEKSNRSCPQGWPLDPRK